MEERVRPAVGEMPVKRARIATEHVPTLGPLSDAQATSILRLLPVLTQLRVVPLVSRSWNRLLWASVLEQLDLQPFKEKINDALTMRLLTKCTQLKTLSLKHCSTR